MVTGSRFDPAAEQRRLDDGSLGLQYQIEKGHRPDPDGRMHWNWAGMGFQSVAYGYICHARSDLLDAAMRSLTGLAALSLAREEWRAWTQPIPEQDFLRYGGRSRIDHPDRSVAFVAANLVLLNAHWLRTGSVDRDRLDGMFAQPMDVPAAQGVLEEPAILWLSAWEAVRQLKELPDPGGNKRPQTAGRTIGQMLADDPAQLHDAKSPVRRRARAFMRQSMERRWLTNGHAVEAMNWLQTFEWREGESGLSPQEVMWRAYAYMPDVDPPSEIADRVEQLRRIKV